MKKSKRLFNLLPDDHKQKTIKQKNCSFEEDALVQLSAVLEDMVYTQCHSLMFCCLTWEILGSAEPDLLLPSFPTINLSIHLIVFLSTVFSLLFPTIICLLPMLPIGPSLIGSSSIAPHVNPSSLSTCQSLLSLHLSFLEAF